MAARLLVLLGLLALHTGCVQRRLLIRSNPEGALVSVDHQIVGHTPVAVPFSYYGTRLIKLEKDGYETSVVKQRVNAPWYAYPPIGFFVDNLAFREVRDSRVLDFQLSPRLQVNEQQLLNSANQLRQEVQRDMLVAPASNEAAWQQ